MTKLKELKIQGKFLNRKGMIAHFCVFPQRNVVGRQNFKYEPPHKIVTSKKLVN